MDEIKQLLQDYEAVLKRIKERLITIEFRIPGLGKEDKRILGTIIYETLVDLAQVRVPPEMRARLGPELMRRIDEMMKIFLPEEN